MKCKLESNDRELWDISYTHLKNLLPLRKRQFDAWWRFARHYYKPTFKQSIHRVTYRCRKRYTLEIKFLERELKYRDAYPEYRTFCELFVIGINEKTGPCNYRHRMVRQDESFLLAFAGWCEDHGMMVQSRKLMWLIDRIKEYNMPKEKLISDIMKQPMKLKEFE